MKTPLPLLLATLTLGSFSIAQEDSGSLKTEKLPGEGVWVDPAIEQFPRDEFRVTAWFEDQFLGDGEAYLRRTEEFEDIGRTELRIPPGEEGLIYQDINLFDLRAERKNWEKVQKKFIQSTR